VAARGGDHAAARILVSLAGKLSPAFLSEEARSGRWATLGGGGSSPEAVATAAAGGVMVGEWACAGGTCAAVTVNERAAI
jgi:hypothetical protein